MATVKVSDDCIGCGTCENICSDVFEIQDDGLAHVIVDDASDFSDAVEEAKDACPVSAITVD